MSDLDVQREDSPTLMDRSGRRPLGPIAASLVALVVGFYVHGLLGLTACLLVVVPYLARRLRPRRTRAMPPSEPSVAAFILDHQHPTPGEPPRDEGLLGDLRL
jgi:hypothetical protein